MDVTIDDNMADSDKRDVVMKAAAFVQAFYDSNHNHKKNMQMDMLKRKRDRGTAVHRLSQPKASRCRKP